MDFSLKNQYSTKKHGLYLPQGEEFQSLGNVYCFCISLKLASLVKFWEDDQNWKLVKLKDRLLFGRSRGQTDTGWVDTKERMPTKKGLNCGTLVQTYLSQSNRRITPAATGKRL